MKSIDELPRPVQLLGAGVLLLGFIAVVIPIHIATVVRDWSSRGVGVVCDAVSLRAVRVLATVGILAAVVILVGLQVAGSIPDPLPSNTVCAGLYGCGLPGSQVFGMVPVVFIAFLATVVFLLLQLTNTDDPYRL